MPPSTSAPSGSSAASSSSSQSTSMFAIPPIIRTLFDSFPLTVYPPESHPLRCPGPSKLPTLYVWLSPTEAREPNNLGRSFDPECLKWQTYLRFLNIEYKSIPSSNHACSGGPGAVLPFLIPPPPPSQKDNSNSASPATATASSSSSTPIIPAQKLLTWARTNSRRKPPPTHKPKPSSSSRAQRRHHTKKPHESEHNNTSSSSSLTSSSASSSSSSSSSSEDEDDDEAELDPHLGPVLSFHTLLTTELTNAILYTTHLVPTNKHTYLYPLLYPNLPHPLSLIHSLLIPSVSPIPLPSTLASRPGDELIADGIAAIDALAGVLGGDTWFFGGKVPGLMDAEAFAYLDVVLRGGWGDEQGAGLVWAVRGWWNLMAFWRRVVGGWWGGRLIEVGEVGGK
ncbi:hypothetical protein DFH27DRAFT_625825 [Peziza echinospora]|nr:hypothetical protein DFH27DRAFT_625825 [Peziza echinospora]